jgi:hypothetical protein
VRAPSFSPILKTQLPSFGALALMCLAGCAASQPKSIHDAAEGPSLISIMQRVKQAQAAVRKMAEAGNSVALALGATSVELDVSELEDPATACPASVATLTQYDVDMGPMSHQRRLARALVMLDRELMLDGNRSIGCASLVPAAADPAER